MRRARRSRVHAASLFLSCAFHVCGVSQAALAQESPDQLPEAFTQDGLSLSYEIVTRGHNGRLEVESE